MHVFSEKAVREFAKKYADAVRPLRAWLKLAEQGNFRNFTELKKTFGSVDLVPVKNRDFYVFDIGGNKYRLIAAIHFNAQNLFIRHVLTHAEYDTEKWKQNP